MSPHLHTRPPCHLCIQVYEWARFLARAGGVSPPTPEKVSQNCTCWCSHPSFTPYYTYYARRVFQRTTRISEKMKNGRTFEIKFVPGICLGYLKTWCNFAGILKVVCTVGRPTKVSNNAQSSRDTVPRYSRHNRSHQSHQSHQQVSSSVTEKVRCFQKFLLFATVSSIFLKVYLLLSLSHAFGVQQSGVKGGLYTVEFVLWSIIRSTYEQ